MDIKTARYLVANPKRELYTRRLAIPLNEQGYVNWEAYVVLIEQLRDK